MVRAKFVVHRIEENTEDLKTVVMYPVYGNGTSENAEYWKYTPSGEIRLRTINEAASSQFTTGQEFYVDFTPAEAS